MILERYGLKQSVIRAYFHYHPTFYNMHVHFAHIKQVEKAGAYLGRGLLLEDVIDNLELKGDYYQTQSIICAIGDNTQLFKVLKDNNLV